MSEGEVVMEVGPAGTGALPCALLISMKASHGGAWDMEVAVDSTMAVQAVLISPDGAPTIVHPLTPTHTPQGPIHYAAMSVTLSGPGVVVEILAPDQSAVDGLSTYVRPDRQRSFNLMRLPPGPDPGAPGWGPAGAQRWEYAVTLVGAWQSEVGIVLDFLVDDGGRTSRVNAHARPGDRAEQAWLAPVSFGPFNPSLARLWLPGGTQEVDLTFHASNGDMIDGYQRTIHLGNLPAADPLSINASPSRPAPRAGSLLAGGARYTPGAEGMHEPPPAAPPSFPAKPMPVPPPHQQAGFVDEYAPGYIPPHLTFAGSTSKPKRDLGASGAVRRSDFGPTGGPTSYHGQTVAGDQPAARISDHGAGSSRGLGARDLQKVRRRTGKIRVAGHWPSEVGVEGNALGPPGTRTGKPMLTLLNVERHGENIKIELFLDDDGGVASIALAAAGYQIAEITPPRITTYAPCRMVLEAQSLEHDLLLFCRNAYGEAFPNLTAGLDPDARVFRAVSLDHKHWGELVQFAPPLSLDQTLCATCRREILVHESVLLQTLTPRDRAGLRVDYALTSDARALCATCHEEKILEHHWLSVLFRAVTVPNLKLGIVRLAFAYAGGMLLLTPLGRFISQILLIAFAPRMEERMALGITAALLAFVVALPPWPALLAATVHGLQLFMRTKKVVGAATLGVPLVVGMLAWAAKTSAIPLPGWYVPFFYHVDLHLAVAMGFLCALLVVLIANRTAEFAYVERMKSQRKMVQMGQASRLVPRLLNVSGMAEFDRAIDRVLMEGFGALEFQVFSLDPDTKRFQLKRSVGPLRPVVGGLAFRAGDGHRLGWVAKTGRPLTQAEANIEKATNATVAITPIPSVAVIPVWVRGEVTEVYNIARMRGVNLGAELAGLLGMLTVVAGRGLTEMVRASEAPPEPENAGPSLTISRH